MGNSIMARLTGALKCIVANLVGKSVKNNIVPPSSATSQYILGPDGEPVHEPDILLWGRWMQGARDERMVARSVVGEVLVSTVFLGFNHNFKEGGKPILWETKVFGGDLDGDGERYSSKFDAEEGHERMVEHVRALPEWRREKNEIKE
jgi:hypothetical protein